MHVSRDVWNCKSWKIIRVNLDSGQIRFSSGILEYTSDIGRNLKLQNTQLIRRTYSSVGISPDYVCFSSLQKQFRIFILFFIIWPFWEIRSKNARCTIGQVVIQCFR